MSHLSLVFHSGPPPVTANDMNSLVAAINDNDGNITNLVNAINQLRIDSVDAFRVVGATGLAAQYNGGVALASDNITIRSVPSGSIVLPANKLSYVYLADTGVVSSVLITNPASPKANLPAAALPMAQVTTSAGAITLIVNEPRFKIPTNPDNRIVVATKSTVTNLGTAGIQYGVPGWNASTNDNNTLDVNSGVITVPATDFYSIEAQVLLQSTSAGLAAKLSLYSGSTEIQVLDEINSQLSAGSARILLRGKWENNKGATLIAGQQFTIQVGLKSGVGSVINADNNTFLVIRRGVR